jgi:hypothetical protein
MDREIQVAHHNEIPVCHREVAHLDMRDGIFYVRSSIVTRSAIVGRTVACGCNIPAIPR